MIEEQMTVKCATRLSQLEHEHYLLEDQIKNLNTQIKELRWGHAERLKVLNDERAEKTRQLEAINAEAKGLRQQKQLS